MGDFMYISKLTKYFFPKLIVIILIIGIVVFLTILFLAAKNGINIWVNILIPSLLPFIIGANLIVSIKVVDIIGALINPITQFIFNEISCKNAFSLCHICYFWLSRWSQLASDLRLNKDISTFEGQRLVFSFSFSTSGPLFIIGAVAVGMRRMHL